MICFECHGMGKLFEGAQMHANPGSYSSYDEVWVLCPCCNGAGETWKLSNLKAHMVMRWRYRPRILRKEEPSIFD